MYLATAGPSVNVKTSKPQSLLSVPGAHWSTYVVTVASFRFDKFHDLEDFWEARTELTTDATISAAEGSAPGI